MPEFKEATIGRFCWVELQAKDTAAAKKFYGELFGWAFEEMPMPVGTYTLAKIGSNQVAGLMTMPEESAKMGVPPNWGCYIAVADVKAGCDAAAKLGGKIILGPTPMGPGTFAVIQDPTGGIFMLWHTPQSMGTFLYGEPGALTWNELLSTNADVAQRFYTQLFGWKAEAQDMGQGMYTVFKQGGEFVGGGLMAQPPHMKGAPSAWFTYFAVADADATLAKATRLGAKILMPATDIPNVGRFGWLQDPQGTVFAILKNSMPG